MTMLRAVLLLVLVSLLASPAFARDAYDLRPRFEAGQTYRFEFESWTYPPGVTGRSDAMRMSGRVSLATVKPTDEETPAVVRLTIDSIRLANAPDPRLERLEGASMLVEFEPDGTIRSMRDEHAPAGSGRVREASPSGAMGQFLKMAFAPGAGTEAASVRRAAEWTGSVDVPLGNGTAVEITTRHELRRVTARSATVAVEAEGQMGSDALGRTGIAFEGTYRWNTGEGMLIRFDSETTLDIPELGKLRSEMRFQRR
jgi:hypothetical protein